MADQDASTPDLAAFCPQCGTVNTALIAERDSLREPGTRCSVACEAFNHGGACRCSQLFQELPAAEAEAVSLRGQVEELTTALSAVRDWNEKERNFGEPSYCIVCVPHSDECGRGEGPDEAHWHHDEGCPIPRVEFVLARIEAASQAATS